MEGFVQNRFLFISRLFLVNGRFPLTDEANSGDNIVPKPKMLISVVSESMNDEMDFDGVILVSDLGGLVLSRN